MLARFVRVSARVLRNGTVRGGEISPSSALELGLVVIAVLVVCWLVRLSTRDDLFRL